MKLKYALLLTLLISHKALALPRKAIRHKLNDAQCLSASIYHEARGEGMRGMSLVGNVILNRAKIYNKSLCGIVFEQHQFSWTKNKKPTDDAVSRHIANMLLLSERKHSRIDVSNGATYFARANVKKRWMRKLYISLRHKGHVFYRGERKTSP